MQQTYLLLLSKKTSFITSKLVLNTIKLEHKQKAKQNEYEI